ncbi:MAG: hypothetical protein JNL67_05105 [Planctomycetaceae bacterium]|nr:hypothetical protein [Planctomycetaceae bacterium]
MGHDPSNQNNPNIPPSQQPPYGQPPQSPYATPNTSGYQAGPYPGQYPQQGDATGGLIPYKNPLALIAYYTGVASLIPCLGLVLSLVAIVLAILGLMAVKKNPVISGTAHAWVAIALSLFSIFYHVGVVVLMSVLK